MPFNKISGHGWLGKAERKLPFITPKKVLFFVKNGRVKPRKQSNNRYYVRIKDYRDEQNYPGITYDLVVILDNRFKKIVTYFEYEPKPEIKERSFNRRQGGI